MKTVHFLGIGGAGASAVAALAQVQGFEVTGCDLELHNEFTTVFKKAQLFQDHNPAHLAFHPKGAGSIDILAVTPAIYSLDPQNPELVAAKKQRIPILTWQQFLGQYLTKNKFVIAVCGTHGKSTTTAMIAQILEDANLDPMAELGAIIPRWGTNYRVSKGKLALSKQNPLGLSSSSPSLRVEDLRVEDELNGYFVLEADEFNDNFLHFKPDITVVTNIEMDHPEYFKDFEAVKLSFKKFLLQTKSKIIANLSDPVVKEILSLHPWGVNVIIDYSKNLIDFPLQIPGQFNILNASAAYQVAYSLGINAQIIQKSLSDFKGIGKRFEYIGQFKEAKIYSDFGHHPTEIKVTMEAARQKFPKQRILLIFQPHMFSRTKFLFDDFVKVFQKIPVDKIFILDIYPSRERDTGLVSSVELTEAISKNSVIYAGSVNQALDKLKPQIKSGDIVFFMSAGDTDYLAKKLYQKGK